MVPHLNNQNSPYYMATHQCSSDQIRLRYQSPDGAERGKLRLIAACALARIIPIDAPFFDIHDETGPKQKVADAVALVFGAKAAIHPA
jgi:citrate lyase beta subunit